jgi:glucose-1-phosphate adenylyltransferase
MKTRAVILAGGEGSRLGILTAKRTKPAVPFAGKYRIIDFTLSNCINSDIFDVFILVQYRPHSLIEHIGAGGPWDLNRDFTGGIRIYTPYKTRASSEWYLGNADAVQQNFRFIKNGSPDMVLILSGDHIYRMDYNAMLQFHQEQEADLTLATIPVTMVEATRLGIVGLGENHRVTSFVEKPTQPPSNLANMGVYLYNLNVLDRALWEDHQRTESTHDFGKDILPRLVNSGLKVCAYPFEGYWVDVGTVDTYWHAHMDLLATPPSVNLNDRSWIVHTRTEERPPVWIAKGSQINDSMITDGCEIEPGVVINRSVLSPGVLVRQGAVIRESIILTGTEIGRGVVLEHAIIDKKVIIGANSHVGSIVSPTEPQLTMIGKNTLIPDGFTVEAGAVIGTDVIDTDFASNVIHGDEYIQTKRSVYEF